MNPSTIGHPNRRSFVAATLAAPFCGSAFAAGWPERPVQVVVPFPPGGTTDILARRVSVGLSNDFKQPFTVLNKAGASGQIGSEFVARALADGLTLMVTTTFHVITPAVKAKLPYDTYKDFAPIALLATTPNVLLVAPDLPAGNLQEFIALAKKTSGGVSYASAGVGGATHMSGEMLKVMTGAPMVHIPYAGMAPAMAAMLGNQVQAMFSDLWTCMPYIKEGKVKVIGITSASRVDVLPTVATFQEQGLHGYESTSWQGVFGPAGLPADIVERVHRSAVATMNAPESTAELTKRGLYPSRFTTAQYDKFVQGELTKWKKVAVDARVVVE